MDLKYMKMAFEEAWKAYHKGEIPVGAVIVKNDEVIAKAYNKKEQNGCAICHAEILAIQKASRKINNWRLENCDIYVTLEPCPMCASAIKQSRITNVYSALSNSDENNTFIVEKIFQNDFINPSVNFVNNVSVETSKNMLQSFFLNRRKNKKNFGDML